MTLKLEFYVITNEVSEGNENIFEQVKSPQICFFKAPSQEPTRDELHQNEGLNKGKGR